MHSELLYRSVDRTKDHETFCRAEYRELFLQLVESKSLADDVFIRLVSRVLALVASSEESLKRCLPESVSIRIVNILLRGRNPWYQGHGLTSENVLDFCITENYLPEVPLDVKKIPSLVRASVSWTLTLDQNRPDWDISA